MGRKLLMTTEIETTKGISSAEAGCLTLITRLDPSW